LVDFESIYITNKTKMKKVCLPIRHSTKHVGDCATRGGDRVAVWGILVGARVVCEGDRLLVLNLTMVAPSVPFMVAQTVGGRRL
jgi:hypothetical protein